MSSGQYFVSNFAGNWTVIERDDLVAFASRKLSAGSPVYEDLKSRQFLIDSTSNVAREILALQYRTKVHHLKDFTALHIFVVTLRCEHSCPYCQVSRQNDDTDSFDMSEETARLAVNLAFRSPSPAIKIEFQGGEPLLNWQRIEQIVNLAKAENQTHQKDLQFVIATNLALLTDPMLAFCKMNNVHISTSLDGPADLHNRNRPRRGGDSHRRAVEGIERCRNMLGRDAVSALMTTTAASIPRVVDVIDEYITLGFEGIFLRPLSPYGFAVKTKSYGRYDTDSWLQFYERGLRYILQLNLSGRRFVEYYAATILTKMLTSQNPGYVDLMSPAGIGIAAVVYNYDGRVFASDEGRMLAESGDNTFLLGNVHENSYEDIFTSDALLEPLEQSYAGSAPMCVDCAFEPYCGSDPVFHHATQSSFVGHKPTSEFCRRNMAIFSLLVSLLSDPTYERVLRSWVRSS